MAPSEHELLRRRLRVYLIRQAETANGATYLKSKHIAADLDVSVKRIGVAMGELEAATLPFQLVQHGGDSNGTTWYVDVSDCDTSQTSHASE